MNLYKKMYFTILMLFYMVKTNQSFKENCENNIVNLKCKKNDLIITEIHQNGICISCGENVIEKPGHNHVKKKDKELNRLCGKKKLCNFNDNDEKLFKGYKCVFQNQHHVCVPNKQIYNICGNEFENHKSNLGFGFLHSPNYPYYYENNKSCKKNIELRQDDELTLHLLNVNVEDASYFRRPKDFLKINDQYFYGRNIFPISFNSKSNTYLEFRSDFMTRQTLETPKGFLIYFNIQNNIEDLMSTSTYTQTLSTYTTTVSENSESMSSEMNESISIKSTIDSSTESSQTSPVTTTLTTTYLESLNNTDEEYDYEVFIIDDKIESNDTSIFSSNILSDNEDNGSNRKWILSILTSTVGILLIIAIVIITIVKSRKLKPEEIKKTQDEAEAIYSPLEGITLQSSQQ